MRYFIGLSLPRDLRIALTSVQSGIEGAGWYRESDLHLTLRFLGECSPAQVLSVKRSLQALDQPRFALKAMGVGAFSSHGRRRVLWAGVAPSQELVTLAAKCDQIATAAGFQPEHQRFAPHISLGAGHSIPAHTVDYWIQTNAHSAFGVWDVNCVVLFSSSPLRIGAEAQSKYALEFVVQLR